MQFNTAITAQLNIRFPIFMAPMFLVSNETMMQAAIRNGIAGVFPSLNFRNEGELDAVLGRLQKFKTENRESRGSYGVNLIVQKTNPLYSRHLDSCVRFQVPFYITSLGNPREVIEKAHDYGAKVYCDVTNLEHAAKGASLGADGFIAVGQGAGGHAGPFPLSVLIPALKRDFPVVPVIAAGGIATGSGIVSMLAAGAEAVSIGTRFIASAEAGVSEAYKQSILDSGMKDIVMTTRISGTPCTIVNTPYAKKIGYEQNRIEKFLSNNPRTRKYYKMLVQMRGMQKLEQAVKPGNYNNLWCAGQSVEMIDDIRSCSEIITVLIREAGTAWNELRDKISA